MSGAQPLTGHRNGTFEAEGAGFAAPPASFSLRIGPCGAGRPAVPVDGGAGATSSALAVGGAAGVDGGCGGGAGGEETAIETDAEVAASTAVVAAVLRILVITINATPAAPITPSAMAMTSKRRPELGLAGSGAGRAMAVGVPGEGPVGRVTFCIATSRADGRDPMGIVCSCRFFTGFWRLFGASCSATEAPMLPGGANGASEVRTACTVG